VKSILFFVIAVLSLALAMFIEQLHGISPEVFEPVYQFIKNGGADVLYITSFLAFIIALFSWLSTWTSLLAFVILMVASGYFLSIEGVVLQIGKLTVL
jgi:hypothetical protein